MLFCSFVFNNSIFGNILSVTIILTINTACDPYGIALYNDSNSLEYSQENVDAGGYYSFPITENRKRKDNSFELKFKNS